MFYEQVFRVLHKHEVRYLVVGGVAVNLYGVLRMTADLKQLSKVEKLDETQG
jgi:hypothetical protein